MKKAEIKSKTTIILNGKSFEIELSVDRAKSLKRKMGPHLCWDCQNACTEKCEKVIREKSPITDYSFITEGTEIVIGSRVESLLVSQCDNFLADSDKQYLSLFAERYKLLKAREALLRIYCKTEEQPEEKKNTRKRTKTVNIH